MDSQESYVYKKVADWSLFHYGFAIPIEQQVVFSRIADRFLQRGESKSITLILNGKSFRAKLSNHRIDKRFGAHADIVQVRYTENSDLAIVLRNCLQRSYAYIKAMKSMQEAGSKKHIGLPESCLEYLAIYTTEYDDTYLMEPILAEDIQELRAAFDGKAERRMEAAFNYDIQDSTAEILEKKQIVKIRKLNRKIGDNLKLLYEYRCQICGQLIGEQYGSHIAEAHHIDYFVNSLNNDSNNQMIVCPNHHSIIHDANPVFDRKQLQFIYENGYREGLRLNLHL